MKKLFFIFILLLTCVFNAHGADMKIGFVDLNKALNESENGKNATEALENMVKSKKSVLIEKEKELKILDNEVKKQASVLTPESMKSKTEEFNKLYKNYQRMVKDFQEEVQKKEAELTRQIQEDLIKTVQNIGEKEKFYIILEKNASGILHAQKDIDLTDMVIKQYNEMSGNK